MDNTKIIVIYTNKEDFIPLFKAEKSVFDQDIDVRIEFSADNKRCAKDRTFKEGDLSDHILAKPSPIITGKPIGIVCGHPRGDTRAHPSPPGWQDVGLFILVFMASSLFNGLKTDLYDKIFKPAFFKMMPLKKSLSRAPCSNP